MLLTTVKDHDDVVHATISLNSASKQYTEWIHFYIHSDSAKYKLVWSCSVAYHKRKKKNTRSNNQYTTFFTLTAYTQRLIISTDICSQVVFPPYKTKYH